MPDEKDINRLLAILRDESQPAELRQEALRKLMEQEADLQTLLRANFKPEIPASKSAEAEEAYARMMGRNPRVIPIRRWLSIAAAIIVGIVGVWLFKKEEPKPAPIVAVTPITLLYDTISNTGTATSFHRLKDGTTVHLEANSYLWFADEKKIFLHGAALFTVNKDVKRPFSVFVNGIEVLDLGTVFSIASNASSVKVKLIQGKVLVRSALIKDLALIPGQEFSIDTATKQYAVNEPSPKNIIRETKLNKQLVFKNTSLQEVFTRVEKECGVLIKYDKKIIGDKAFTGTFDAGSNARNIIAMVCMINDLNYELKSNTIYIHQ